MYDNMVSVLKLMYHGEVNVAHEELNSFLTIAEDLQAKGLTQTTLSCEKSGIKHPFQRNTDETYDDGEDLKHVQEFINK